jgi:cell division protein FtsI (penicillin-binding protein 3)
MAEPRDPLIWRRTSGPRLAVIAALFGLCALAILVRLVDLQIFQRAALEARAENQRTNLVDVPAQRGDLLDRHGKVLAYSVDADTLCAVPNKVRDPERVVSKLCDALGDCDQAERAALSKSLSRSKKAYALLRHQVSPDQARRVAALQIDGVYFDKEPHRYYPNRELAASVLGYVGADYRGLAGLEATYDKKLRGRPGQMLLEFDGRKRDRRAFNRVGRDPVAGDSLELTIDANLQYVAERELDAGVLENHADGGAVVIMDPVSGEILALASNPTFNPNSYGLFPPDRRRNRGVQDVYEPGSTFKIVTASAALEEKTMRPTDLIDTGGGSIAIGPKRVVREAQGHNYGTISFTDVIVKSSNVGAIKIGLRLGAERLGRYVGRFGFGTRLSPDFPSESAGIVWQPSQWTESALASVSMGYQVSVTPLQMATAASVVANGGELVQPRIVRAVIDADRRLPVPRKVIRRVTSPETAAEMTAIMEAVVEEGTGKMAKLEDFTVAGKTGTANKNKDGHYLEHEYNVSFVGFVPSRKPALTIIVVIDTPRGPNPPFGGTVSAPIFHRIADAALRYLGATPTVNPVPPVLVARYDASNRITVAGPAKPMTIVPAVSPSAMGQVVLPELRGLSGREALRVLARLGITPHVVGDGVVIDQNPLPGAVLEPGGACRLGLGRPDAGIHP